MLCGLLSDNPQIVQTTDLFCTQSKDKGKAFP
jgi:hypothetical protein